MNDSALSVALAALERTADQPTDSAGRSSTCSPSPAPRCRRSADLLGSETLAASDAQAARLDELQFDLGEGPCWDALRSGEPRARARRSGRRNVRDGRRSPRRSATSGISSIFAFPLAVGPLRIGAIDLYSASPVDARRKAHPAGRCDGRRRQPARPAPGAQHPRRATTTTRGTPTPVGSSTRPPASCSRSSISLRTTPGS